MGAGGVPIDRRMSILILSPGLKGRPYERSLKCRRLLSGLGVISLGDPMSEVLSVDCSYRFGLKSRPMSVLSVDVSMGEVLSVGCPMKDLSP